MERQMIYWGIYFQITSNKGLVSRIYKELATFNSINPQTIQLENEQKMSRDISPKSIYSWQISTGKDAQHY